LKSHSVISTEGTEASASFGDASGPHISPDNALQLHFDQQMQEGRVYADRSLERIQPGSLPSMSTAAPSLSGADHSSTIPGSDPVRGLRGGSQASIDPALFRPSLRVRFRSRVRIGSGTKHHRKDRADGTQESINSSPSSSISAPLRYAPEAEERPRDPRPAALSEVLPADSATHWLQSRSRIRKGPRKSRSIGDDPDERTPLNSSGRRALKYGSQSGNPEAIDEQGEAARLRAEEALRKRNEDEVAFGPWPWRFFNRHWWKRRLDPLISCCYDDTEEFDAD